MKKGIFGILSFVLIAVVAVNCGPGGNPFVSQVKDGIGARDYDAALAATDSILAQNPNSPLAYYYKGEVYANKANKNNMVGEREADYVMAYENYTKAMELNMDLPDEEKVGEVKDADNKMKYYWGQEHNAAINIATDDSLGLDPASLSIAADHLKNAIAINPDSTFSYEVLAEVFRRLEQYDEGAKYMQMAVDKKNPASPEDYNRLSVFYSISGQNEKNVAALEEALELYPDSVNLVQKMADAYMTAGQSEDAINILYKLIENDEGNLQYHLVVGTQLYQAALKMSENEDADSAKVEDFTNRAEEELTYVLEKDPESVVALNTLAIMYQNKAAALFEARNAEPDNAKANEIDKQAKDVLAIAAGYYERAVELVPEEEQKAYWETLFRVYTTLDWVEKRDDAMKKAGF
jgi:tetratricopeptide (TPR) repeat protein